MKKSEAKQKQKENETNQTTSRQQEIDNEINMMNTSGLQSPPTNEKCDSYSKITSHSSKTERR